MYKTMGIPRDSLSRVLPSRMELDVLGHLEETLASFGSFNPLLPDFTPLHMASLNIYKQVKDREDSHPEIYLSPEIIQSSSDEIFFEELEDYSNRLAKGLYPGSESPDLTLPYLMTNGTRLPIKFSFLMREGPLRTVYVKPFELSRIIGLELYNLLSGRAEHGYKFNFGVIAEKEVLGSHEGILSLDDDLAKKLDEEKFKALNLAMLLGVRDVVEVYDDPKVAEQQGTDVQFVEKNQLLITDNPGVVLMDFNVMGRYKAKERDRMLKTLLRDRNMSSEDYARICREQLPEITQRVRRNWDYLMNIVDSLRTATIKSGDGRGSHIKHPLGKKLLLYTSYVKKNLEKAKEGIQW